MTLLEKQNTTEAILEQVADAMWWASSFPVHIVVNFPNISSFDKNELEVILAELSKPALKLTLGPRHLVTNKDSVCITLSKPEDVSFEDKVKSIVEFMKTQNEP